MSKKYYWKIAGRLYEVSREQYYRYRKETSRQNYLNSLERQTKIVFYNALDSNEFSGENIMIDHRVNVEEEAINNVMIKKLHDGLKLLSDDELYIIAEIFEKEKSER